MRGTEHVGSIDFLVSVYLKTHEIFAKKSLFLVYFGHFA